jgi:5-methylcytosine-specific restriction endonuclease McrA
MTRPSWWIDPPEPPPPAADDYYGRKVQATPPWSETAAIRALYRDVERKNTAERKRVTRRTFVPWTADHIIPLRGENVSGLHVLANLQVVRKTTNSRKGNRVELHDPR